MENTLKGYISSLRDNVLSRKVFLIATVLFCGFFMTAIPAHATITEVELVVDKITSNKTIKHLQPQGEAMKMDGNGPLILRFQKTNQCFL